MALTEMLGEAGDLIGGLIADAISKGDYEAAERLMREAAQRYDGIALPDPAQTEQMGPSAFGGVELDKASMDARRAALQRFQQIGMEGGMDAESRAALAEAKFDTSQHDAAQRGALMQRAQERGLGSGSLNAASQLIAQQGASQRLAMAGTQAAGDARRRALQALAESEGIARGMTQDEYRRSADRAAALDAVNRFNTGLRADAQTRRWGQQMDLADAQSRGRQLEAGIYEDRARRRKDDGKKVGRATGAVAGAAGDAYMGGA
jgi:hypothetical protein